MSESGDRSRLRIFVIFYVSLLAISAELLLALMLSLKAYSHMVYVVISFALLGYGLGSTGLLVFGKRLEKYSTDFICGVCLAFISTVTAGAALALPHLPVFLEMIFTLKTIVSLSLVYAAIALPFTGIGFLMALLFTRNVKESRRLYFWDLLGAGAGAIVFFPLIGSWGPLRLLLLLSIVTLLPVPLLLGPGVLRRKALIGGILVLAIFESGALWLPEPVYVIDKQIGWEWIPGYFPRDEFDEIWRTWHPLGRTDLHRMKGIRARRWLTTTGGPITFEICVDPIPEFCYFTNCYRAGTPVYALSEERMRQGGHEIKPFSVSIEAPYVLLDKPKVLVIGAGGGRDLFMAKVHGASEIIGAEINPATYSAMSPGGVAYEYSGKVYTAGGAEVFNIDGRHLVKNRPLGHHDLVILNGIDTFAALSTGAYAFAENYLYTQEAIVDYLRILNDNGIINFNRWYEGNHSPRETLRLILMAMDALRTLGANEPSRHIILGNVGGWGILLVKRTPFSGPEEMKVMDYFSSHGVAPVYSPSWAKSPSQKNSIDTAVAAFRDGTEQKFIDQYWADVSVVHDDNPFFYKYYRFSLSNETGLFHPAGGATAFHVQALIIAQTVVFILIFIFLPLILARKSGGITFPSGIRVPFIAYFAALGAGFILIEITLMQRLTLALGSPIYSVSVTLATILIATGVGSLLSGAFRRGMGTNVRMIGTLSVLVVIYLLAMVWGGTTLLNVIVRSSLGVRIATSALLVAPLGVFLGVFYPTGLLLVGDRAPGCVAWAWGINSGFTVLGSTVTIVIAQFLGFNTVLLIAAGLYLLVPLAYYGMSCGLDKADATGASASASPRGEAV